MRQILVKVKYALVVLKYFGNSIMNFVPFPFSLSKEIVPFIASIIRLEAAKPNP